MSLSMGARPGLVFEEPIHNKNSDICEFSSLFQNVNPFDGTTQSSLMPIQTCWTLERNQGFASGSGLIATV